MPKFLLWSPRPRSLHARWTKESQDLYASWRPPWGRMNEEEGEEEVEVSCTDLRSMITGEDSVRIAARYGLEVLMPYELKRSHHPPEGYVTVSKSYLKFGVKFPLHLFFLEILRHFGLTVS